jgi:Ca-activated chloride channel family protein
MPVEFAFPMRYLPWWALTVAAALLGLWWALRALERSHGQRMHRFAEAGLARRLLSGYRPALRKPLFWLPLIGFAFLLVALAQPHWGAAWQESYQRSRDVLVLLDTSESMRAADPQPSRLERARQKVRALLEQAPADRFGLIAFSGAATLQVPLTRDHAYFRAVLDAIDTNAVSLEGTDIAAALELAIDTLRTEDEAIGGASADTRAVVLISDGEAVEGDAVARAEDIAELARTVVLGVGAPEGAEVAMPDWMRSYGHRGVDTRTEHVSRLDEAMLKQVALAGNGWYTRARPDQEDIRQVVQQLDALSARTVGSEVRRRLVNRYQAFLAVALGCFAAEAVWLAALPVLRRWRMRHPGRAPEAVEHG